MAKLFGAGAQHACPERQACALGQERHESIAHAIHPFGCAHWTLVCSASKKRTVLLFEAEHACAQNVSREVWACTLGSGHSWPNAGHWRR